MALAFDVSNAHTQSSLLPRYGASVRWRSVCGVLDLRVLRIVVVGNGSSP
jgi:hypothetical protein